MKLISDNRGYANALSGLLHLLDLPAPSFFKHLIENRLPRQFLSTFLHETTHFWCFASNLGTALAAIEMKTQRELSLKPNLENVYRGVVLGDAINSFLAPLLEGVALFVEFDSYPGSGDLSCQPVNWAVRIFRPETFSPEAREESITNPRGLLDGLTKELLDWYRESDLALSRKTTVLMQPLRRDPELYLAGYLTIKRLWVVACQHTPAFDDREFFITFLHTWVFEDWTLIGNLLDDRLSVNEIVSLFSIRLQERLQRLAFEDLTREAELINSELSKTHPDWVILANATSLDLGEASEAKQKLDQMLAELVELAKNESEMSLWAQTDLLTYAHRRGMIRLSHEPVEIEVNKNRRALIRRSGHQGQISDVYLSGPAPEHAEPGTTKGWLVSYYVPAFSAIVTFALRDSYSVLSVCPTEIPEEDLQTLSVLATKMQFTEVPRRAARAEARQIALDWDRQGYQEIRLSVRKHSEDVYSALVFNMATKDADVESIANLMNRAGMYDVLRRDGDVMTALVKLSLCSDLTDVKLGYLADYLHELDIDISLVFKIISDIQIELGWPFVIKKADGDLLSVV